MSRAMKFRAWSPIAQKMYAVTSLEFDDDAIAEIAVKTHETDGLVYSSVCSANCLELMQFTGWRDHSKNDVYEGDIVQFITGHRGVVVWDNVNDGWRIRMHDTFLLRDNEMNVIGTLYEHPDLLKEQS